MRQVPLRLMMVLAAACGTSACSAQEKANPIVTAVLNVAKGTACELVNCNQVEPIKVDNSAYVRPQGWQTECVGRWLVDVPAPIDLGESFFTTGSYSEFFNYAPVALKNTTRAQGAVSIGPVAFSESIPLTERVPLQNSTKTLSGLRYMANRTAGYHYTQDFPDESYIDLFPKTDTETAWAGPGRFQVSLQRPEDQRGRFYWKDQFQQHTKSDPNAARDTTAVPPVEEALAREVLNKLVPRYAIRQPGQQPSGAGVCTPHGFFADTAAGTERDSRVSVSFVDPRYTNLVLHVDIKTRMPHTETRLIPTEDIRKAMTPWAAAEEMARESKKRCRSQQGTASRDMFGCSFAGATGIKDHWDVQYMKLANGQEARVLVVTYPAAMTGYKSYDITIETAGKKGSVTEPRIVVRVEGIDGGTDEKAFDGKEPPPLHDAFNLAVTLAKSLRPRPGAIDANKPVLDPWVKFRR